MRATSATEQVAAQMAHTGTQENISRTPFSSLENTTRTRENTLRTLFSSLENGVLKVFSCVLVGVLTA